MKYKLFDKVNLNYTTIDCSTFKDVNETLKYDGIKNQIDEAL